MSNNIILELRNKDAQIKHKNGDWTSMLDTNFDIEDGDTILVKNSFIDTEATESQKIIIPTDLSLNLSVFKYLNNWKAGDPAGSKFSLYPPQSAHPADGDDYLACHNFDSSGTQGKFLNDITGQYKYPRDPTEPFDVTYKYIDLEGTPRTKVVHVAGEQTGLRIVPGGFSYRTEPGDTITITPPPEDWPKIDTNARVVGNEITGSDANQEPASDKHFDPYIESVEISLQAGNYAPTELTSEINRQLNVNNGPGPGSQLVQSVFLRATSQFNPIWCPFSKGSNDAKSQFKIDPAQEDYWYGASQMELSYDPATQNFKWNYLHMPYYTDNDSPLVLFREYGGNMKLINKNSGVAFQNLTATRKDTGADFDFWTALLGFKKADLILQTGSGSVEDAGETFKYSYVLNGEDGKTLTGQFDGVDSAVSKTGAGKGFAIVPTIPADGLASTSSDTIGILAANSSLNQQFSFGYFLVEVNAKFENDFYTINQNRGNIKAIVSRYYSLDSYTSGNEQGSVVYTHEGPPLTLSSFACRILNSDKELATNIGEDSTIFLEIVKAPKAEKN
jgi:hypothetical protein